jgi:two-component system sensor histidine kinase GlrK
VYYPRSFLKFILLGFLLVSLPLVSRAGRAHLLARPPSGAGPGGRAQAAQAGRASRQLFEQSTTLERIVRQHLILEDSALLDDYGRVPGISRDGAATLVAAAVAGPAGHARCAG